MLLRTQLPLDASVNLLKAAGEPTRLRLLALLAHADLTVSDLMDILGQSQPRISRHLKLLAEAGLLERYQEGSWAYFRAVEDGAPAAFLGAILERVNANDPQLLRDREQLATVRARRARQAADYFAVNAASWDAIRKLHVDEAQVEAAILDMLGNSPFQAMLDLGTGTGRMLELLSPLYVRATGIDTSREMLTVARSNLEAAGISGAHVRQGDMLNADLARESFDLVTIHQVLHFLDDPARAIRQAARTLRPGGRMLIVDFAPHALEFLRDQHAHLRLGFAAEQVAGWLEAAGLEVREHRRLDAGRDGGLVVTIWLAQDPRMLIADAATGSDTA